MEAGAMEWGVGGFWTLESTNGMQQPATVT